MTFEQKRELSVTLGTMPANKLAGVVETARKKKERAPGAGGDTINFDGFNGAARGSVTDEAWFAMYKAYMQDYNNPIADKLELLRLTNEAWALADSCDTGKASRKR